MNKAFTFIIIFFSLSIYAQKYKVYAKENSDGASQYAIFDKTSNKRLTDFIYNNVTIIDDAFFIVYFDDNTVQVLNTQLKELLPPKKYSFANLSSANNKYIVIAELDKNPKNNTHPKYGIYDVFYKKEVVQTKYSFIGELNKNGIAPFNKGGKDMMPQLVQGGKWGYIKVDGTEITPAKFTWCSNLNDKNIGKAYIGGNSQDGLYGGYWSLVNEQGKFVIDDKLYHVQEGEYYSTAPSCEEEIFLKSGSNNGSIFYNCNNNTISKSDYFIVERIPSLELTIVSNAGKNSYGDQLYGVVNKNGKLVIPIQYNEIRHVNTKLLLEDKGKIAFFYNPSDGKITDLKLKDVRILSKSLYPQFEKEKVNLLIIGKNIKGKTDLLDEDFNQIIKDIDAPYYHGYKQDYFDIKTSGKFGDLFGFEKSGNINYYSIKLKKLMFKENTQELGKDAESFLSGKRTDSIFVKQNGKWGLIHPVTFSGSSFIYDSLTYLNDGFVVAHSNKQCFLYTKGTKAKNFPAFDKLLAHTNTGRYVPRKSKVFIPYKQLHISYKNTTYLLQFVSNYNFTKPFEEIVLDKGNISGLKQSMYIKDGVPYLLFSKKPLPKGTISCNGLDDWTSKSDIPIYDYRIGDLYGIIDENGKIIFEPKYPVKDHVTTYPPSGFDYKVK